LRLRRKTRAYRSQITLRETENEELIVTCSTRDEIIITPM
jgi:hypothetical protein